MACGRSRRANRIFHRPGAHLDLKIVHRRAGHRHHESRGISEVALELYARRPGREPWPQTLKLQVNVAKLLAAVFSVFGELDVDEGRARQRNGFNSVVIGPRRVNCLVLRNCFLDGTRDQLLHLLRGCSWPLAGRHGHAHWYLRVLTLRHRATPKNAPPDDAEQRSPGDLAVLDEIAGRVIRVLDQFRIGCMRHRFAPLGKHPYFLTIPYERAAQDDNALARAQAPGHFYGVTEGLADLDDLRLGIGFPIAGDQSKYRETVRIGRSPHHRAQRNCEARRRIAEGPKSYGADHARLYLVAFVFERHFDRENAGLWVGLGRDRCHDTLQRVLYGVEHDRQSLPQPHHVETKIRHGEFRLDQMCVHHTEADGRVSHQRSAIHVAGG